MAKRKWKRVMQDHHMKEDGFKRERITEGKTKSRKRSIRKR